MVVNGLTFGCATDCLMGPSERRTHYKPFLTHEIKQFSFLFKQRTKRSVKKAVATCHLVIRWEMDRTCDLSRRHVTVRRVRWTARSERNAEACGTINVDSMCPSIVIFSVPHPPHCPLPDTTGPYPLQLPWAR